MTTTEIIEAINELPDDVEILAPILEIFQPKYQRALTRRSTIVAVDLINQRKA